MSFDWPSKKLGNICTKIGSGATPRGGKEAYLSSGEFSLIRSQNIYNDGFSPSGLAFISAAQAKKLDGVSVEVGDVLLNITGDSVARVCRAPAEYLPARVNQHVAIIRPDPEVLNTRYLHYFLASPNQQENLLGLAAAGATRNALTKGMIEELTVPCPPLQYQKAVADSLGALDDRITLLRETKKTLESIAQAIFKSWFVDFDPVRAKMEGRQPEGMDEDTAALFPDSFEESELGLIPRGWKICAIGNLVETVGGGTPDTKNSLYWSPATHHWTSPKDLSGLSAPVLLTSERRISDQGLRKISSGLLPAGTLLMSSRAPIGYLALAQIPVAINQGYIAMPPGGQLSPNFMLFWCQQNMEGIKGRANGSTFMEISKKVFRQIPVVTPCAAVLEAFGQVADRLLGKIIQNARQAETLSEVRDTLLPRLISGQLRLPEAQEQIKAALP